MAARWQEALCEIMATHANNMAEVRGEILRQIEEVQQALDDTNRILAETPNLQLLCPELREANDSQQRNLDEMKAMAEAIEIVPNLSGFRASAAAEDPERQ